MGIGLSEYQFYEFLAVDRPLNARQLGEVRSLSTRADITPTSFMNVYHWGNFGNDPRTMMERYYDAHLYLTNWGTREVMLRLPSTVLAPDTVGAYCLTDSSTAWTSGGNIILAVTHDGDGDDDFFDEDGYGLLASIVSVRAELAAGDRRPLYLAWLHSVAEGELDDDEVEPPVPANLATLTSGQRSLVNFIRLDQSLLDAATEGSRRRDIGEPTKAQLTAWVRALPASEKDALIVGLMRGEEPYAGTRLLRRYHGGSEHGAGSSGGRTVGQLLDAAQERREGRARVAAKERERQQAKAQREAAVARQRRLDDLARDGDRAWQRVSTLVDAKKAKEYDAAVAVLCDLRDLSDRDGNRDMFTARLRDLRERYGNRPALLERLDRAGLKTA
jgi:hypothetical protein